MKKLGPITLPARLLLMRTVYRNADVLYDRSEVPTGSLVGQLVMLGNNELHPVFQAEL